jgi:hypothetical protein
VVVHSRVEKSHVRVCNFAGEMGMGNNKIELYNKKPIVKISGQWLFRELNLSFSAPRKHYQSLHFSPVLPISLKNEQNGKRKHASHGKISNVKQTFFKDRLLSFSH